MLEMQMVVALLVQRLHMSLLVREDYGLDKWESYMEDWFVVQLGELHVKIIPRTKV